MQKSKERKAIYKETGFYIDIGFRFALTIVVFLFLGLWIDNKTGLKPVFLIIGVFFGAGTGFYSMYKSIMYHQKKEYERKKE